MTSEIVYRHDRDGHRVADAGAVNRVSVVASKRNRESEREDGRARLRKLIGIEEPPTTLRERIMANVETPTQDQGFDVIAALRAYRKERERQQNVRHY